ERRVMGALGAMGAPGAGADVAGEGAAAGEEWAGCRRLPDGTPLKLCGPTLRLGTSEAGRIQPVLDALRREGLTISAVRPYRPSLEDLFMQAVTDPATGQALPPGAAR